MYLNRIINSINSLCFLVLIISSSLINTPLKGQKKVSVQADEFIVGKSQLPQPNSISSDSVLFFDKNKFAIRGGRVLSSKVWEGDSIGLGSVALGQNTVAKGDYSFAVGINNRAGNYGSVSMGVENDSKGSGSVSMGIANHAGNL